MAVTENGAKALFVAPRHYFISPGTGAKIRVASADAVIVFRYISERWHREIEPIKEHTGWRFATKIRGTRLWSNHCSGYAMDVNRYLHMYQRTVLAMGKRYTGHGFTDSQLATLRSIRDDVNRMAGGNLIRLGVDYPLIFGKAAKREDGMHVECAPGFTLGMLRRAAAAITAQQAAERADEWADGVLKRGDHGKSVQGLQSFFIDIFPAYPSVKVMLRRGGADGEYGPATEAVVREFQTRVGITPDGVVGTNTRKHLKRFGWDL